MRRNFQHVPFRELPQPRGIWVILSLSLNCTATPLHYLPLRRHGVKTRETNHLRITFLPRWYLNWANDVLRTQSCTQVLKVLDKFQPTHCIIVHFIFCRRRLLAIVYFSFGRLCQHIIENRSSSSSSLNNKRGSNLKQFVAHVAGLARNRKISNAKTNLHF